MERKKHTSNLIQFFHFSFFGSGHTIPIIIYSTSIFLQKDFLFFFHFQHDIFFFTTFYSRQNLFFVLKKTNKTPVFSIFYFIQNETLSYCEKETEWKIVFFCIFFKDSKHIFLFRPKSNFQVLMTSWNLLTQKQENIFLIFSFLTEKSTTHVSALLSTCKKNIRTEMSFHVS